MTSKIRSPLIPPNYDSDLSERAAYYRAMYEDREHISLRQIQDLLSDMLYNHVQMLEGLVAQAPFREGDLVTLVDPPEITEKTTPGWMGSKHFIIAGAPCIVRSVKFDDRGYSCLVEFERDSYIPTFGMDKGKEIFVEPASRGVFGIAARRFVKRLATATKPGT